MRSGQVGLGQRAGRADNVPQLCFQCRPAIIDQGEQAITGQGRSGLRAARRGARGPGPGRPASAQGPPGRRQALPHGVRGSVPV